MPFVLNFLSRNEPALNILRTHFIKILPQITMLKVIEVTLVIDCSTALFIGDTSVSSNDIHRCIIIGDSLLIELNGITFSEIKVFVVMELFGIFSHEFLNCLGKYFHIVMKEYFRFALRLKPSHCIEGDKKVGTLLLLY